MKKINQAWLPYMGAIVQAGLFAIAGYHYFDLGGWGAAAGFGVGMLVNFSMAIASSKVSDVAKSRKPLAYVSLIALFLLSPVIICSSLGWSLDTVSCSLVADLSIMLTGAIAGKSLVAQEQPAKSAQPKIERRSAKKSEIICRFAGAGCGRKFASQNAANAHARTCGYKPTIAMPVDVARKV